MESIRGNIGAVEAATTKEQKWEGRVKQRVKPTTHFGGITAGIASVL